MTSGHPFVADTCFLVGAGLFLGKFLAWEFPKEYKRRTSIRGTIVCITVVVTTCLILADHYLMSTKQFTAEEIAKEVGKRLEAKSSELRKLFPGGFKVFEVVIGGGAPRSGHDIVKGLTSYNIDIAWGKATITELTSSKMTIQLENVKVTRMEMTPSGSQPMGAFQINGAVIWQIDRGPKLVYINNAISFWSYVFGGFVISDTDDALIVAIGLQKTE